MEFATVTRSAGGKVVYHVLESAEIEKVIAETELPTEEDS